MTTPLAVTKTTWNRCLKNLEHKGWVNPLAPKSDQHQFSPKFYQYVINRKAYMPTLPDTAPISRTKLTLSFEYFCALV